MLSMNRKWVYKIETRTNLELDTELQRVKVNKLNKMIFISHRKFKSQLIHTIEV